MDESESYKFCKLSLSGKLFLFTLMQIWHVSFRDSCLHWLYWKNDIAPAGIERDSIPTHHETHVFAMVIRSFHCFKMSSYKFLAEWGSVYWLTAYCISMPPSLLARFIKKCCSQSHLFVCVEVFQLSQPNGSCRARSVYLTTHLLTRLSPLSG